MTIAALLSERAGYVQRGLTDRVDQVDAQLVLLGHDPAAAVSEQDTPDADTPEQDTPEQDTAPPGGRRGSN